MRVGHFGELDTDRWQRTGTPEVILAEDKQDAHLAEVASAFVDQASLAIVSRLDPERVHLVEGAGWKTTYHQEARLAILRTEGAAIARHGGRVAVISAGTADVGIAEEARLIAETTGSRTERAYDVGVAGPHRIVQALDGLAEAPDVFICVAGREAALPTVLAGMVEQPVIGVPTSVGYGHGGGGESALMGLLQACAPLVTVNIDAGVPAGLVASKIARQVGRHRR